MIGNIATNPHLVARDTGTPRGRGVFTRQDYREGDIIEASPVLEIYSPFEKLPRELQLVVYSWGYLSQDPRQDLWGVALGMGSLFNHCDTPNLSYGADPKRRALVFRATRDIDAGEELTIDYNADIEPGNAPNWFQSLGVEKV